MILKKKYRPNELATKIAIVNLLADQIQTLHDDMAQRSYAKTTKKLLLKTIRINESLRELAAYLEERGR